MFLPCRALHVDFGHHDYHADEINAEIDTDKCMEKEDVLHMDRVALTKQKDLHAIDGDLPHKSIEDKGSGRVMKEAMGDNYKINDQKSSSLHNETSTLDDRKVGQKTFVQSRHTKRCSFM